MHYHCEVVIPPTDNVQESVEKLMWPYCEDRPNNRAIAFWDWWVIGGRWGGHKVTSQLSEASVKAFFEDLKERGVTVSAIQCGKQSISPKSQIPMVDSIWRGHFPGSPFEACPLFDHASRGGENMMPGDVLTLAECPTDLTASRVIFANTKGETQFMLAQSFWNGANFEQSAWDGLFGSAVQAYRKDLQKFGKGYCKHYGEATDDWLVVTVDYHS